jgi:hypothetical protein
VSGKLIDVGLNVVSWYEYPGTCTIFKYSFRITNLYMMMPHFLRRLFQDEVATKKQFPSDLAASTCLIELFPISLPKEATHQRAKLHCPSLYASV